MAVLSCYCLLTRSGGNSTANLYIVGLHPAHFPVFPLFISIFLLFSLFYFFPLTLPVYPFTPLFPHSVFTVYALNPRSTNLPSTMGYQPPSPERSGSGTQHCNSPL